VFDDFVQFFAAFLVELGNRDADDFPVDDRVDAEFGFLDGMDDGLDERGVPRLNDDEARFGRGDAGRIRCARIPPSSSFSLPCRRGRLAESCADSMKNGEADSTKNCVGEVRESSRFTVQGSRFRMAGT
jgi:hypothetical protein